MKTESYIGKNQYYAESNPNRIEHTLPELLTDNSTVDPISVLLYLAFRYSPGTRTIFRDIRKVPPGFNQEDGTLVAVDSPIKNSETITDWNTAAIAFTHLLRKEIEELPDSTPIGTTLTCGLDSNFAVSLAKDEGKDVVAYSAGFDTIDNEGIQAEVLARNLGIDHTFIHIDPTDYWSAFLSGIDLLNEPVAPLTELPIYLLTQKKIFEDGIQHSMFGVGVDEVYNGYGKWIQFSSEVEQDFSSKYLYQNSFATLKWLSTITNVDVETMVSEHLKNEIQLISAAIPAWEKLSSQEKNRLLNIYWRLPSYEGEVTRITAQHNKLILHQPYYSRELIDLSFKIPAHFHQLKNGLEKPLIRHAAKGYLPDKVITAAKTGCSINNVKTLDTIWTFPDFKDAVMRAVTQGPLSKLNLFRPLSIENELNIGQDNSKFAKIVILDTFLKNNNIDN